MNEFEEFDNPIREGRKSRKVSKQTVFTDMNAMVDLAFLLLTFFMLTTTMTQPKVIELVMPVPQEKDQPADVQPVKESRAMTIVPFPNDELFVFRGLSGETVKSIPYSGPGGLRDEVREFLATVEEAMVMIKPHPDSNYRNLVDVLDEMNLSGVQRYAIDDFGRVEIGVLSEAGIEIN